MSRKKLYEGTLCSCCGEKEAKIKGFCHTCYKRVCYQHKPYSLSHSEKTESILCDLREGMKQAEIAKKHGVSRQYVSQVKNHMEAV